MPHLKTTNARRWPEVIATVGAILVGACSGTDDPGVGDPGLYEAALRHSLTELGLEGEVWVPTRFLLERDGVPHPPDRERFYHPDESIELEQAIRQFPQLRRCEDWAEWVCPVPSEGGTMNMLAVSQATTTGDEAWLLLTVVTLGDPGNFYSAQFYAVGLRLDSDGWQMDGFELKGGEHTG